ncbi:MAG: hypothetical protein MZV64_62425 [Ignavibacteriales bacterium]|nr:hypothetical protein [Ignavibacteriales bacterium]
MPCRIRKRAARPRPICSASSRSNWPARKTSAPAARWIFPSASCSATRRSILDAQPQGALQTLDHRKRDGAGADLRQPARHRQRLLAVLRRAGHHRHGLPVRALHQPARRTALGDDARDREFPDHRRLRRTPDRVPQVQAGGDRMARAWRLPPARSA